MRPPRFWRRGRQRLQRFSPQRLLGVAFWFFANSVLVVQLLAWTGAKGSIPTAFGLLFAGGMVALFLWIVRIGPPGDATGGEE